MPKPQFPLHPETENYGVIDIGSNSVRLVVYHHRARVPIPVFNEKYYCALGRGVATSGQLNPQGVTLAHAALARFALMLERMQVRNLSAIATAAMRQAEDGPAFIARAKRDYGFDIRVIDGDTEARLAAAGIFSAFHEPDGLVADLGGGSLELARLNNGESGLRQSLPIGSLTLMQCDEPSPKTMRRLLKKHSSHAIPAAPRLYAIGGSFRTLAKLHCALNAYPEGLLHGYTLTRRGVSGLIRRLSKLDTNAIAALPGVSSRRAPAMHAAAMLLRELMRACDTDQVVCSVSGIREGLAYEQLDADTQAQDPLLSGARDLGRLAGRSGTYAAELFEWTQPLFTTDSPALQRLRQAIFLIGEIAWTIDPVHRADWSFDRVIHSAIKGISHHERVLMALAVYHRYSSRLKMKDSALKLLSEHDMLWAQRVGIAANLAFQFSAGRAGNLHHVSLTMKNGLPNLHADNAALPLISPLTEKKLAALAEVCG